jgi:hypothetical protein
VVKRLPNAPACSIYQAHLCYPGYLIKGPGVRMRVFNEDREIAFAVRDALSQAFAAGRRYRGPVRRHLGKKR